MTKSKYILILILCLTTGLLLFVSNKPAPKDATSSIVKRGNNWSIPAGTYLFENGLMVPWNVELNIQPGATLKFGRHKRLSVYGKIIAIGTPEKPIIMTSMDNSFWRGVKIMSSANNITQVTALKKQWPHSLDIEIIQPIATSLINDPTTHFFEHVIIDRVDTFGPPESLKYNYMASVEILGSNAIVNNVTFKDIKRIGALRAFDSKIYMSHNKILGDQIHKGIHINNSIAFLFHNRIEQNNMPAKLCNDGFWILNSFLLASNNTISGKGDDGIDLKNSTAFLSDNILLNNKDEGIDVDHDSSAIVIRNKITNSENGIQISGASEAYLSENIVQKNINGIQVRGSSRAENISTIFKDNNNDENYTEAEVRSRVDVGWSSTGSMQGKLLNTPKKFNINILSIYEDTERTLPQIKQLHKNDVKPAL